jgi:translation initiation factor IF-2
LRSLTNSNKEAAAAAKRNGIEIRYYNIIYDLVDDIKKAMSGLLAASTATLRPFRYFRACG